MSAMVAAQIHYNAVNNKRKTKLLVISQSDQSDEHTYES